MEIIISDEIRKAAPGYRMIEIEAVVVNAPTPDALWQEIERTGESLRSLLEISDINKRPGIAGTRAAYKALGKEPNRYRPSCESMCRRLVKGMNLYRIDALVDLVNLLSLKTGYSIGGFDGDKIQGDTITLSVAGEGDEFEGIGRGVLNIAHMPAYRDAAGVIGTPTSDHERTKMELSTRNIVMCINIYREEMNEADTIAETVRLLETYAAATDIRIRTFR